MRRFIDVHIPITSCNLNCHYCYVSQENDRDTKATPFLYTPEHIGKALTAERLGGVCHFNICGLGETLIPEETVKITYELLKNGHYVMIVTNALLVDRIKEFCVFPKEYKERLGFKCSFHFLELKKRGLMDLFFNNIDLIRENGMSFTLEMTPSDELEPYIEEIKEICINKVGAYCHVTIPRDMSKNGIALLSQHSFDDFCNIWSTFESDMFKFKIRFWGQKRSEFCYAGEWSGLLNAGNGIMSQCYGSCLTQNIFEKINEPIKWFPIGHNCCLPHCYNSHSLLGLGVIPMIKGCYSIERDRIDCRDGSHWLNDRMREFLGRRLEDYNTIIPSENEKKFDSRWKIRMIIVKTKRKAYKLGRRIIQKG